jgi:SAM-dependent methyltransferase
VSSQRLIAERLKRRYFGDREHPFVTLEREVTCWLRAEHTLLEVGCGSRAEVLGHFRGKARYLIGLDVTDFDVTQIDASVRLIQRDINDTGIDSESVDTMFSRAVMEHLADPVLAFREIHRVLRPAGHYVFLTPNLGHYSALLSLATPNSLHPWLVRVTEGRQEEDTFPTYYRCNSKRSIEQACRGSGLVLRRLVYLNQYPSYFMFNAVLIDRYSALRFFRGWLLGVVEKPQSDPAGN